MKKSYLLILGILIITAAVLFIGWENVYQVVSRITINQLIFLAFLQLMTLFMNAFIWHYLLKQKAPGVSLFYIFMVNLAGTFVESVTPSVKIGGETMKVYLTRKKTKLSYPELTAIAVVSKFFSLIPFLFISFFTLVFAFFSFELPFFVYLAFVGLLIFFSLFFLFFNFHGIGSNSILSKQNANISKIMENKFLKKTKEKLKKVHGFLSDASEDSKKLVTNFKQRAILFSVAFIVWAFYPIKVYIVAYMLGFTLDPLLVVIAIYTAYLVSMVPLLPGGLATFEGTMAIVLAYQGLTSSEALSIALMTRVVTFWIPLLISAFVTIYFVHSRNYKDGELIAR